MADDFAEIGHSGGEITFNIDRDEHGRHSFGLRSSSSRPVPLRWIAVYAMLGSMGSLDRSYESDDPRIDILVARNRLIAEITLRLSDLPTEKLPMMKPSPSSNAQAYNELLQD